MRPSFSKLPWAFLAAALSLSGCDLLGKDGEVRPLVLHLSLDDSLKRYDSVHIALARVTDPATELEYVWRGRLDSPADDIPTHTLTMLGDPFLVKVLGFRKVYGYNGREQLAMATHIIYEQGRKRVERTLLPPQVPFNRLSRLSSPQGTLAPPFSMDVSNYTLPLAKGVTSVVFDVMAEYSNAAVAVGGEPVRNGFSSRSFAIGDMDTTVLVTVTDIGQSRTYQVQVEPEKSLPIRLVSMWHSTGTLTPDFHPDTSSYLLSIPALEPSVDIKLWPTDPSNTSLLFQGTAVFPGQQNTVRLDNPGDTTLAAIVLTKGGTDHKYTLRIDRAR